MELHDPELRRRGLVDAEHLLRPLEFVRRVAVFPAPHLGDPLRLPLQVGKSLDFRHVNGAADRTDWVAVGAALDEGALQDGPITAAGIANPVSRRPTASARERGGGLRLVRGAILRMDALGPGANRLQFFGIHAQHVVHAAGSAHHASGKVPFEDDPVHGVRRELEYLFALGEASFRLFPLGDIAGVDHHPVDIRVVERGYTTPFQPAVRAVLVTRAQLPGKALERAVTQFRVLEPQSTDIIRMHAVENRLRQALLGGIPEGVDDASAHIEQFAVAPRHANDLAGIFGQREPALLTTIGTPSPAALGHFHGQDRQPHDLRLVPERLQVDLEPAGRRTRHRHPDGIIMEMAAFQGTGQGLPRNRRRRCQDQCGEAQQILCRTAGGTRRTGVRERDGELLVQDQKIKRQLVDRR